MKTFNYKEKFAFSEFYPAIAALIICLLCVIFGYGIAIGNLRILAYPNSAIITGIIAAAFLADALVKLNKSKKAKQDSHKIEMTEEGFSFPKGGKKTVTVRFSEITELGNDEDEDDGRMLIVRTQNGRYVFEEEKFDGKKEYEDFAAIINERLPAPGKE